MSRTYYQVHVILCEVEEDDDHNIVDTDILEEDEPHGYRAEYEDVFEARKDYNKLTQGE